MVGWRGCGVGEVGKFVDSKEEGEGVAVVCVCGIDAVGCCGVFGIGGVACCGCISVLRAVVEDAGGDTGEGNEIYCVSEVRGWESLEAMFAVLFSGTEGAEYCPCCDRAGRFDIDPAGGDTGGIACVEGRE